MNRSECLDSAREIVTKDRESQYGSPEDNFQYIANLWEDYLHAQGQAVELEAHDVAVMMCLLKIARIATGKAKEDSFIDLAGYAACACELATKE